MELDCDEGASRGKGITFVKGTHVPSQLEQVFSSDGAPWEGGVMEKDTGNLILEFLNLYTKITGDNEKKELKK